MNILIITPGVLPVPAVSGGAVENLIEMLIEFNELNGNDNITITSIENLKAIEKSKKYYKTNFIFFKTKNVIKKIRNKINKIVNNNIGNYYIYQICRKINLNEYDCIVVENVPEYGIVLRKKYKGKLILHLHNDRLNSESKNAIKLLNLYDSILCLSDFVKQKVESISNEKTNKVYTVHNGIDIDKFKNVEINEEWRKKFDIKDEKVILYTGRLVEEKGVRELIKAFIEIEKKYKAKLIIAGSVNYNSNLESNYVKELKKIAQNNKNIIFTGYINYNELPQIYKISDLGIIPSIWDEPFALTVVEHLASGNPVIVTNSGGMPELINEKCSIIVEKNNIIELQNAIESFLKLDATQLNKMKNEALKQSEYFSKNKYTKEFFERI